MTGEFELSDDTPVYVISVAAQLSGMHPQTLRAYDRLRAELESTRAVAARLARLLRQSGRGTLVPVRPGGARGPIAVTAGPDQASPAHTSTENQDEIADG